MDLATLSFPELTGSRTRLLDALADVSGSADALSVLGVGESLADEVHANTSLRDVPAGRAERVYTGVLFDAFDPTTLTATGRRRAARSVLIFSALFGVLRPGDQIPAYRLGGAARLPGIGTPASYWRSQLDGVIDASGLVVDCRSSTYAGMWTPREALSVRVFQERAGRRTPVSHMAKHARGLVARALCEAQRTPRNPTQAADVVATWFDGHPQRTATGIDVHVTVELGERSLDIVTR